MFAEGGDDNADRGRKIFSRCPAFYRPVGGSSRGRPKSRPERGVGTIKGRVTDDSGARISNVYVEVFKADASWPAAPVYSTGCDDSGRYLISGLSAGNYKVGFFVLVTDPFLSEWYHDQKTFEAADQIAVSAGSTAANIDAQLAKKPTIELSKRSFRFGAVTNGPATPAESLIVSSSGPGSFQWTAMSYDYWISVSPSGGVGNGLLTVGIARTDLEPATYASTSISVTYQVYGPGTDSPPFGALYWQPGPGFVGECRRG